MFVILASVSLWNGTGCQLASCTIQENLYFSIRDVRGLMDELGVTSSDGSLPDPGTCGSNCLKDEGFFICTIAYQLALDFLTGFTGSTGY